MSDYTDREIPVLDDIISSPVKTDELLADAKISNEPAIQAPESYENVQLDIQLDEPVLISEIHASPAHDELDDTPHNLIHTEQDNNDHSDSRIEPKLHQPETFEHETDTATDNADDFATNTTNDSVSETIENAPNIEQHNEQPSEQQTPKEERIDDEYDDPDILPSGERLYRYIPETPPETQPEVQAEIQIEADAQNTDTQENIEAIHPDVLETDISGGTQNETHALENEAAENEPLENEQAETSYSQDQEEAIADANNKHDDSDDNNKEDGYLSDTNQNNDVSIPASAQKTDISEHESALIDYQTDVDPYSIDETEKGSQTPDAITDDAPQWQDIQQEISDIQAETSATATENLILSTLNNLDTDALTEQVLQNILPNVEQQLRLHIKESIEEALDLSVKQIDTSENND